MPPTIHPILYKRAQSFRGTSRPWHEGVYRAASALRPLNWDNRRQDLRENRSGIISFREDDTGLGPVRPPFLLQSPTQRKDTARFCEEVGRSTLLGYHP